ncbi:hypothetical protein SNOG_07215 [Parastagonospora nodorum SN15]|uniref:Uncharacterized protein n=1 Tax=Phaeosphaeria nodorum (strain SN15 / ATCC MYA-4574 / FGSC 10173) TaxID=321614 RepID=Q0ULZ9_PHANO|nr:hypothetical protein SNOG_07215 [Parastagonospora nodorum SN15]EAT85866.1 hypothetical protein SNOG_07215 [Parastagonospora nodorum SN15]
MPRTWISPHKRAWSSQRRDPQRTASTPQLSHREALHRNYACGVLGDTYSVVE